MRARPSVLLEVNVQKQSVWAEQPFRHSLQTGVVRKQALQAECAPLGPWTDENSVQGWPGTQCFCMCPLESGQPGDVCEPGCSLYQGSRSFWKQAIHFWQTNSSNQSSLVNVFLLMLCSWPQRVKGKTLGGEHGSWNQIILLSTSDIRISFIIFSTCLLDEF